LDYQIPWDLQLKLSSDPDSGVRACLSRNREVAPGILAKLAQDPEEVVRGHAVLNTSCPDRVVRTVKDEDPSELVQQLAYFSILSAAARIPT
jgi:hypothetical protein